MKSTKKKHDTDEPEESEEDDDNNIIVLSSPNKEDDQEMSIEEDHPSESFKNSGQKLHSIKIEDDPDQNDDSKIKLVTKKKYKIILDPYSLIDDNMHGGADVIMSTIVKSRSSISEDNQEEYIENDENSNNYEYDEKSVSESGDSGEAIKIKIVQDDDVPIGISKDDLFIMDDEYKLFLENMVKTEFYQLQSEIEAKENKRKDSKKRKKYINFLHILQKRLKKKVSSRKTKIYIEKANKPVLVAPKKAVPQATPEMKRRSLSSKIVTSLNLNLKFSLLFPFTKN